MIIRTRELPRWNGVMLVGIKSWGGWYRAWKAIFFSIAALLSTVAVKLLLEVKIESQLTYKKATRNNPPKTNKTRQG